MITHLDVFSFVPLLQTLHWIAGLIILAEALNKLERTQPFARGLDVTARLSAWLKLFAWMLLAIGGAGALITPLMQLEPATLQDAAVIVGFAMLVIRSRFKERRMHRD